MTWVLDEGIFMLVQPDMNNLTLKKYRQSLVQQLCSLLWVNNATPLQLPGLRSDLLIPVTFNHTLPDEQRIWARDPDHSYASFAWVGR